MAELYVLEKTSNVNIKSNYKKRRLSLETSSFFQAIIAILLSDREWYYISISF
jgi:hypothetical protein